MPATGMQKTAAIIGGGPAGLMAAEVLAGAGVRVVVHDRMPSLARKFLMAGRGGLNLTHGEAFETFVTRYGAGKDALLASLRRFGPQETIAWSEALGQAVFTGSSGRVFPKSMKASPLLRAWLRRLDGAGVAFRVRHEFAGWDEAGDLLFRVDGALQPSVKADAVVLACGGASWPRLGSDGRWPHVFAGRDVAVAPWQAANSGFLVPWSEHVRERFAGAPLKNISVRFGETVQRGECVITGYGLEGGVIYGLSALLRAQIMQHGSAEIEFDLRPDMACDTLTRRLYMPRGKSSVSNHLRKACGLTPLMLTLLREAGPLPDDPDALAQRIKALPLRLGGIAPIDRAISSAGGLSFAALDDHFMIKNMPGVFAAGEMLDWEAPTGGYLLQACFASGKAAGEGAARFLMNAG